MKRTLQIIMASILKAIALILLALLTVFKYVLKAFSLVFRLASLPFMAIGVITIVSSYLDNGYNASMLPIAAFVAGMAAAYFLLPRIPHLISRSQIRMKDYALSPIIIRSPVKFTL